MASPSTPDVFVIQGKNYVVEKTLGQGAFGKVYKVRENGRSGSVYALKKIKVENNEAVNMVRKEIGILEQCSHDQIVRLYRVDTTTALRSTYVLVLMEYCEGGNLNSRLARPSDSDTNLRWMRELADAMYYLHSKNIVHRDLKPENVLLTGGSIKLGDFGLAREYAVLRQQYGATRSDETLVSYLNQIYMGTALGTPAWMAPEVFMGHYTESADIFALGTIMYAIPTRACMSVGGQTYYGAFVSVSGDRIGLGMAMRRNPKVMVPLDGLSSSTARQVLRSMLDYNPKNRPSARKVVEKMNSILDLHDSLSPRPQPAYPADNVQPYQESPLRQNPFPPHGPSPQPPSPNFIRPCHSPPRHSPFSPNSPYYPQAGPPLHRSPTPRYGAPSSRIISPSPQPTRGVFPSNAHPSHRSPFRNTPTRVFPIRHVPPHTPSPAFIRSPIHIRIHSPARMTRPRHFSPRHTLHRFR